MNRITKTVIGSILIVAGGIMLVDTIVIEGDPSLESVILSRLGRILVGLVFAGTGYYWFLRDSEPSKRVKILTGLGYVGIGLPWTVMGLIDNGLIESRIAPLIIGIPFVAVGAYLLIKGIKA